jgi:hypothetical protein
MDRSAFSRIVIAAVVAVFLLGIFAYRQYEKSQVFEMIGVVEGFYGSPWSHEARLDMVRFMGEVRMNAYFYAPKDDPYHRQRWREPYSGEYLDRFKDLVRVADESKVTLWYAISPGLSIEYSSEADYQALKSKLLDMVNLGVYHVALFLDDVPEYLQQEADKSRFNNLAEAHVYLINKLHQDLQDMDVALVVCPTTYTSAWGDREYVRILGEGIPREIPLFWTGSDIAPATITRDDAVLWGELMSRKPLLWDNFPVNDFETWRPIIGPIDGRHPGLAQVTSGIVANPMDAPYLSMIPLYTVAEFARRPFAFDQRRSWQSALSYLAGEEGARVLRPLALLYADYGWTDNVFTPLYTPGKAFNINEVSEALDLMDDVLMQLRSETWSDNAYIQNILLELEPFATSTRERFQQMVNDRFYRVDPEGFLVFQRSLEEILAETGPVSVDGRLDEWSAGAFRNLKPSVETEDSRVSAGFRYYSDTLYIALRVQTDTLHVPDPQSWVTGDQVLLMIDQTRNRTSTWVEPTDLMVLVRPPLNQDEVVLTGSLYLTPFSQRGISDITMRTISSFFSHFVGEVYSSRQSMSQGIRVAGRRNSSGYTQEIAIPVGNQSEINLAISVNDAVRRGEGLRSVNFMLQERPYIGNAHTWVPVVLR